uniref:alcohol dehydrogenase catalytic domain-containing protein n=1 Tax=Nocardia farcinica TaxID=37329 RepID=UPI003D7941F0
MKAVVMDAFGDADQLRPRSVADPESRLGWVTVELRASALNWHDVLVRQGRYGSPLPHVPGADGAGVRADTGQEVVILPSLFWGERTDAPSASFEILGDQRPGTYAEYVSVPEECLAPRPKGFSWAESAALGLVGVTAYRALVTRAARRPHESLQIVGGRGGVTTKASAVAGPRGAPPGGTGGTPA